ncbi:hypothetical protein KCU78_g43, partial [Aureobasidium melanogenum]
MHWNNYRLDPRRKGHQFLRLDGNQSKCKTLRGRLLPSGVTCAVGMPQIEPFVTVKQEWAVDWPLQGDPLAGRAAPFRLPSPANIMRLTVSNRTWLNRLQHAMVDGHHGYIKLSDEIADETSPRMKAVRSRSLRTAVCSQYELRDLSRSMVPSTIMLFVSCMQRYCPCVLQVTPEQ